MNRLNQTYSHTSINTTVVGYLLGNSSSGKEKDSETGFSYFGARYYEPEMLNIWLSVDPMADKYPNLSPYNYCAWNPVKLVDPDGRDWYQAEDGTVCWNKGNSATHIVNGVEYKNIGSTYSFTNGNIIYNYNQNRVESIGLSNATSADFPIQITAESIDKVGNGIRDLAISFCNELSPQKNGKDITITSKGNVHYRNKATNGIYYGNQYERATLLKNTRFGKFCRVAPAVGLVVGAYEIGTTASNYGLDSRETASTASEVVGGFAGGWLGGVAAGTIFGVPGAIIGGVVGGIVGGIAGESIGGTLHDRNKIY